MPNFQYKARSASGEALHGVLEGESAEAIAGQLAGGGLVPVSIEEVRIGADLGLWWRERQARHRRVRLDDLILFSRQMYSLTKSGVPIVRSLQGMIETTPNPRLARTLQSVLQELQGGQEFSVGLARHPQVFPTLMVSMVQVGESTGALDTSFFNIARYLESEKTTIRQIKSALRYPSIVLAAIAVAMTVLTLWVIPTFARVYRGFGAKLPWATRILIGVSDFAVAYWPYLGSLLLLAAWGVKHYLGTTNGRRNWDRTRLRLPLIGSIIRRATLARFSRAFAMSYSAGVPLVKALSLTARAVDNLYVGEKLAAISEGIQRGDTLTRTAAASGLFTPLVLQMLAVGEETGAVDSMLVEVADFYDREVEYELANLTSAIEPLLIVGIGVMVLILALGVFLPMWDLYKAVQH